ncbi:MAG: DUF262 domain-containing protein [Verrucomicrobiota bacterium]
MRADAASPALTPPAARKSTLLTPLFNTANLSRRLQSFSHCDMLRSMKYQISQMKLEVLIQYFKENALNLNPAFQRGRVWTLKMRKSLLKNILQGKPLPAIFLYKEATGSRYSYIILDGKQRLESILLYVGDQREDLRIPAWTTYFFLKKDKDQAHFQAESNSVLKSLKDLTDEEMLQFRDYLLSTIEIDLSDGTSLEEIIQLFVDINQQGVQVKRFDIVKALSMKDPALLQVFNLIAMKQRRGEDMFYKLRKTVFGRVLRQLDIVKPGYDTMNQVDIMWEKLFELGLFVATSKHRKPVQILREFISRKAPKPKLTRKQIGILSNVFRFIATAYNDVAISQTRWATEQTHFYIFATALINEAKTNPILPQCYVSKLVQFDSLLNGDGLNTIDKQIRKKVRKYIELSAKQTTDAAKRDDREKLFTQIVKSL